MPNAAQTLETYLLEMRWRCVSLAADLDRIQRAAGSQQAMSDARLAQLRDAIKVLLSDAPNRAEQVQMIFSDESPPPARNMKSQI